MEGDSKVPRYIKGAYTVIIHDVDYHIIRLCLLIVNIMKAIVSNPNLQRVKSTLSLLYRRWMKRKKVSYEGKENLYYYHHGRSRLRTPYFINSS
jgi:uncharacterized Fe-S cluster-containing protein